MKNEKLLLYSILLLALCLLLSGCTWASSLPEPNLAEGSKIFDSEGQLITTLYREKRTAISLDEVPEITQQSVIAVEDSRFYEHSGFSILGIVRAAWRNLRAGDVLEGGSTITQQTAKNLFLGNERTFTRKLSELWYALQLERKYSKKEILEMYLNQIYFGEGAYGIEEAAQTYFGKPARELNLAESAMIAGLPKAPSKYSPFVDWEAARNRQRVVLNRMVETEVISQAEADTAANEELILNNKRRSQGKAPYLVNEVIKYVSDKYEDGANLLFTGGLRVETTLDLDKQQAAEKAFAKRLANQASDLEGGLIAIDPNTGAIVALVGGRDYSTSKFNRALQARRQPGSAFKPFLFTAALEQGYSAGSVITCDPVSFPAGNENYTPTDYGTESYHYRPFTLKEALQVSDNVVSVKLADQVGPQTMVDYAVRMGINSPLRPYLSLALGTSEVTPKEMAAAYAPLANGGFRVEPFFIKKITDNKGRVLEEHRVTRETAIDLKTAYIVTDMLKSVVQPGGTASIVSTILARPSAGKTGTTQNYVDAWFVGYTPELVGAVYIGYDTNRKSVGSTGGRIAAPLWADFAAEALKDVPSRDFERPSGLVEVQLCADTGLLATPFSANVLNAFFVEGTEPTQPCPVHGGWGQQEPFDDRVRQPEQPENDLGETPRRPFEERPRGRRFFEFWFGE